MEQERSSTRTARAAGVQRGGSRPLLSIYSTRLPYMAGARQQLTRRELQVRINRRPAPPCYLTIAHTAIYGRNAAATRTARAADANGGGPLSLRGYNYTVAHTSTSGRSASAAHTARAAGVYSGEARASLLSIYSTRLPYMAGGRQPQLARRELQVQTERRLAPH